MNLFYIFLKHQKLVSNVFIEAVVIGALIWLGKKEKAWVITISILLCAGKSVCCFT